MIKANFSTYGTYVTDSLYQWDLNRFLHVTGLNLTVAPEVHFSNALMDKAIVRQATLSNHVVSVSIPNSLLQSPLTIYADIGTYEGDTFKTVEKVEIPVIPKARPADYQVETSDEEIYSFKKLENEIVNAAKAMADNIEKANATLKARVDNILVNASDTENNAELIDIRVDIDGMAYPSAGEAIRRQQSRLLEMISVDTHDNILPFDKIAVNQFEANGVIITENRDGTFTLNGTCTESYSFEIITRGTAYATLLAGVSYTCILKKVSGEVRNSTVSPALLLNTDSTAIFDKKLNASATVYTPTKNTVLTRFAINVSNGVTYTNLVVAPYLVKSEDYYDNYIGFERWLKIDKIPGLKDGLDKVNSCFIVYDRDNIIPLNSVKNSYSSYGITITYENGVFTLNGTSIIPVSIEIIDRGVEYGVLNPGEEYRYGYNVLSGSSTGNLALFLGTDSNGTFLETGVLNGVSSFVPDQAYTLTRFAINVPAAGITFEDYKVAPYLGTKYTKDYAGLTPTVALQAPFEDLVDTVNTLDILPTIYTNETDRVVDTIRNITADLRLVAFADSHSVESKKYKKYNDLLSRGCIDGVVGLGDYQIYSSSITREQTKKNITNMLTYSGRTPNCFYAIGNHDIAYKDANSGTVDRAAILTKKELFDCTCRHIGNSVCFNEADPYGCYYYVDFAPSKIRMIVLNTSDIYEDDGRLVYKYKESVMLQQPQITWFTNVALDFSDKNNPSDWSVIVCQHAYFDQSEHMIADILSAVKNGEALNDSWTFCRRLNSSAVVDTSNPYTITATKDYSLQGSVNVIGVFYGHDHINTQSTVNGINFIEFITDNAELDDFYVTDINGLSAGDYYITTAKGVKMGFSVSKDITDAVTIGYNNYFAKGGTRAQVRVYDADGNILNAYYPTASDYVVGMAEINGFIQQRVPNTVNMESCNVINIDKDNRKIYITHYGVGIDREITY